MTLPLLWCTIRTFFLCCLFDLGCDGQELLFYMHTQTGTYAPYTDILVVIHSMKS